MHFSVDNYKSIKVLNVFLLISLLFCFFSSFHYGNSKTTESGKKVEPNYEMRGGLEIAYMSRVLALQKQDFAVILQ